MKFFGLIVITIAWATTSPFIAHSKTLLSLNTDKLKADNLSGLTNGLFKVKLHGKVDIVKGIKGKAIKFAYSSGYFSIYDPKGKLNPPQTLSVEFWLYPTKWSQKGDVIINKDWAKGWGISPRYLGNKVNFCAKMGGKRRDFVAVKKTALINRWNHCVFTFDSKSGVFNYYLNGKSVYSKAGLKGKLLGKSPEALRFGPYYPGTHVVIDDLKIINSVMTPADVKKNYENSANKINKAPDHIETISEIVESLQVLSQNLTVNGIELIKNGKAQGAIIIAEDAPDSMVYAATQLASELKNGFGVELPVKKLSQSNVTKRNNIFIGCSNRVMKFKKYKKNMTPEGFQIFTENENLIICGNDNKDLSKGAGTLHGIYRFLEVLGYRWYFPGAIGCVLPKRKTITVKDLDITDYPWAPFRQCSYGAGVTRQWKWKVGFGSSVHPAKTCHSFQHFHKAYKSSKPEIFALTANGKRRNCLCWYNPETTPLMLKKANNYFSKHKNDKYYPDFTMLRRDGAPPVCQCPECLKRAHPEYGPRGELSDYVAEKAVEFAKFLKNKYPNKRIIIGAYNKSLLPPVSIKKLPENVSVQIAKCSMLFWNKTTRTQYYNNVLMGWLKKQPATLSFWEYYGFDNWGGKKWLGVPGFCPQLLADDIKKTAASAKKYNIKVLGERIYINGRCNYKENSQRMYWPLPKLICNC